MHVYEILIVLVEVLFRRVLHMNFKTSI